MAHRCQPFRQLKWGWCGDWREWQWHLEEEQLSPVLLKKCVYTCIIFHMDILTYIYFVVISIKFEHPTIQDSRVVLAELCRHQQAACVVSVLKIAVTFFLIYLLTFLLTSFSNSPKKDVALLSTLPTTICQCNSRHKLCENSSSTKALRVFFVQHQQSEPFLRSRFGDVLCGILGRWRAPREGCPTTFLGTVCRNVRANDWAKRPANWSVMVQVLPAFGHMLWSFLGQGRNVSVEWLAQEMLGGLPASCLETHCAQFKQRRLSQNFCAWPRLRSILERCFCEVLLGSRGRWTKSVLLQTVGKGFKVSCGKCCCGWFWYLGTWHWESSWQRQGDYVSHQRVLGRK